MLAPVLAIGLCLCVCLSVCLSQVGVLSKRMDGSSWFLAVELSVAIAHCASGYYICAVNAVVPLVL